MLAVTFILFSIITLILLGYGIFSHTPVVGIAATGILFYLAILLMTGGYEYVSGENVTTSYTYLPNSTNMNQSIITGADNYTAWDDVHSRWLGRILAVVSVFTFVSIITQMRKGGMRE